MMGVHSRWLDLMLILDDSVVGTVDRGASGDWFAYGCMFDWEDTKLGCFKSEDAAKRTVEAWVRENRDVA